MGEIWEVAWHILVVTGWSIAWRITVLSLLAAVLSLPLLFLCYRFLAGEKQLSLSLRQDRFYRWAVIATWVIAIPTLSVTSGSLLGAWWAGNHAIESERLGERIGKGAFQVIVAGATASRLEDSEYEQAKMARELLAGEQKIPIKELSKYTSHHLAEVSASHLGTLVPHGSEKLHRSTAWAVQKSIDTVAFYQLNGQGDAVYRLVSKVADHDRRTDNDGYVTVSEVADVACETFLDKSVKGLWAALVLEFLLPVLAVLGLLIACPPLLAWMTRKVVAWRLSKKVAQDGPETE